ncbi:hypothetical protein EST38_g2660 [Candolleomyces aberdarensis]|uniref:Uncharacterized protein n=1 Tax=Candolleomyces aberdarensis TaxID=2316362 RepID=A0A4Q2DW55_9AGAR|nr:hypothetical protein EST38_g2660 [Candolleomyces aberdarensis]
MRGAVPKVHVKNHIKACQHLWAFNFLRYSGETYGEMIETAWAENNQATSSTKEMNDGHRHDTLDNLTNYWNWCKLLRITEQLKAQYSQNLKHLKAQESQFVEQSARYPEELLAKWKKMSDVVYEEKGKVISPFEAKLKDAPPTQRKAYEKLLDDEKINWLSGKDLTGNAQFLNQGLELEERQVRVCMILSEKKKVSAADQRKLYTDLVEWQATHLRLCLSLHGENTQLIDPALPESAPLNLPSLFPQHTRAWLNLGTMAAEEYSLRKGQAHDTLESLQLAIQTYNFNVDFKKSNIRGQGANTQAQDYLKMLEADKKNAAVEYTCAREALLNLGLPANDKILRELNHTKLHGKNMAKPPKLSDSKKEDPWFWNVGHPKAMSEKEEREWQTELNRAKWFRD